MENILFILLRILKSLSFGEYGQSKKTKIGAILYGFGQWEDNTCSMEKNGVYSFIIGFCAMSFQPRIGPPDKNCACKNRQQHATERN